MATYGDLKNKTLRLIGSDPAAITETEEAQLLDAVIAAHNAILPWVPKLSSTTFTGDGTKTAFTVPTDFYDVDAIIEDTDGEILPQAIFSPGLYFGESVERTNDWVQRPSGSITFSKALGNGDTYTMHYLARWSVPNDTSQDTDTLDPPEHLLTALTYFSAAYMLISGAVDSSEIRQWNTRVDSGNPEHNPVQRAVDFLMTLFHQEMSRIPSHTRAER